MLPTCLAEPFGGQEACDAPLEVLQQQNEFAAERAERGVAVEYGRCGGGVGGVCDVGDVRCEVWRVTCQV